MRRRDIFFALFSFASGCALLFAVRPNWFRLETLRLLLHLPSLPESAPSIARTAPRAKPESSPSPPFAGLNLLQIHLEEEEVTAPADEGRTVRLTLDPKLQRTAVDLLKAYKLPEAAVVMAHVQTGKLLVYANHLEKAQARDLCVEAKAPAASIFKIVTGAALVERAGLTPSTQQCYFGGSHRIDAIHLVDNPRRDRACTTLAGAMGGSINTVFARLALKHLKPEDLETTAGRFGFGKPVPFDLSVAPSTLTVPSDSLGFARTAAGFWNTTLSPLEALQISLLVARRGHRAPLSIVREVISPDRTVLYTAEAAQPTLYGSENSLAEAFALGLNEASEDLALPLSMMRPSSANSEQTEEIRPETAAALTAMMEHTVNSGTSYRAFHDGRGKPFLPGVAVAGKTGTLTNAQTKQLYTWFSAFAPSNRMPNVNQVAIAVLVVNKPTWHIKANIVAREMLRAYMAEQKVPHVTYPTLAATAEHNTSVPRALKKRGVKVSKKRAANPS